MSKDEKIRHFIYCDTQGINSIFSQYFPNTQEITITEKKSNGVSGSVGIIPYILQGFFGTNITGEVSRDRTTEHSSKVTLSIEDKIRCILGKIGIMDRIDEWPKEKGLVAGHATIIKYDVFVKLVDDLFKYYKYSNFEEYLKDNHNPEFQNTWRKAMYLAKYQKRFNSTGRKSIETQMVLGSTSNTQVIKDIAVDLKYPVTLDYSSEKLLVSNSALENARMLINLPETGILGILTKADTNIYTLKPLAMWHDLSYSLHSNFIDRADEERILLINQNMK